MAQSETFYSFKFDQRSRRCFICGATIHQVGGLEASRLNYCELAWCSMPLPAWQMRTTGRGGGQGRFLAPGHKAQLGLKWTQDHNLLWIERLSSAPCPEWRFTTLSKNAGSKEDTRRWFLGQWHTRVPMIKILCQILTYTLYSWWSLLKWWATVTVAVPQ